MKNIEVGIVASNEPLCRDHFRLTLQLHRFAPSVPGQFVHLCPIRQDGSSYRFFEWEEQACPPSWEWSRTNPMLRRAFSIAGLSRNNEGVRVDVIHRVVGNATRWMSALKVGEEVSVLGPLGNAFPISSTKSAAWLVAGGVGLPPMLWLAEALHKAGRRSVAFCGSQRAELLPLSLHAGVIPARDAAEATFSAAEFSRHGVPVIVSTDDGSIGFSGHIGRALEAYHAANPIDPNDLVVYTCGPERMMHFVAEFCLARGIECHVCMERNMACGLGTCQSCAVPIQDNRAADGWHYLLCCTDGPVFHARAIVWAH